MPAGQGRLPGGGGFHGVAGPPDVHAGGQAEHAELFNGLVGGAVFADHDGIMGQNPDDALAHQRSQAYGVLGVVGEDQKGAGVGNEAAVQRKAVHHGAHAEFAHPVEEVAAFAAAGRNGRRAFP